MKISVLVKDPGYAPRHVHIENSLKNLQNVVGGYIECVTLAKDVVIICNEEGRLMGMPHCCNVCGHEFVGTIILVGAKDDEFCDLPGEWNQWKRVFGSLWEGV